MKTQEKWDWHNLSGFVLMIRENVVAMCKNFKPLGFLPCCKPTLRACGGWGASARLLAIDINTVKSSISELWSLGQIAPINGNTPTELNRLENFTVFKLDLCGLMAFSSTHTY